MYGLGLAFWSLLHAVKAIPLNQSYASGESTSTLPSFLWKSRVENIPNVTPRAQGNKECNICSGQPFAARREVNRYKCFKLS